MKKIISLLLIVLVAAIAYPTMAKAEDSFPSGRVTATGDEPNGDGQPVEQAVNQSGVTYLGSGSSQVKTCTNCQKSGNILLSSTTRRAAPGVIQQTGSGSGSGGTTEGGTSSNPVGTGK